MNIAVFVSGRGSNFKAVHQSLQQGKCHSDIKIVIGDKLDCFAFEFAREEKIDVLSVSKTAKEGFTSWENLLKILKTLEIDLIVLAGFLKKIPDEIVDNYKNKIVNIHPALLPSFGGKGMYGMNVHRAVFESSAQISGATVHFVNKVYDDGKIIAQRAVDISGVESPEEIAARVLKIEHKLLPYVVKKFCENKIKFLGSRVNVLE